MESTNLDINISNLKLSSRALNCLRRENVSTVKELLNYSEIDLLKIHHLGLKSLKEIKEQLSDKSLKLKSSPYTWL